MELSVVTCSYNAKSSIEKFVKEIDKICKQKLKLKKYEIVITDDYSSDETVKIIKKLIKEKFPIKLILLSKNCGNHYAIKQSIKNSNGKIIFEIDSDLEISVRNLEIFWKELKSSKKNKLIYGIQKKRTDNFFNNLFSNIYYKIINIFSDIQIPQNQLQCRIFNNQIKRKIILNYEEGKQNSKFYHELNVNKKEIVVAKIKKKFTNYTFRKRSKNFFEGLIFDSNFILNIVLFTIFLSFLTIFLLFSYIIITGILYDILNSGWIFNAFIILIFMILFTFIFFAILMYIKLLLKEIKLLKSDYILDKINFK